MGKNKVIGLILGIIGVAVTFVEGFTSGHVVLTGIVYAVLASTFFGLYTVLGKKATATLGCTMMNSISFISGSLFLMPIMMLADQPLFNFNPSVLIPLIYLSMCITGIAYLTYFAALKDLPANVGSSVFFIKPIAASIMAVTFLGERITPFLLIGGFLVLLGMYLILFFNDKIQ